MDNRSEAPRAYVLFLEETVKHIEEWVLFCSTPPQDPGTFQAQATEAARRAHMVKGGAGFFGLDEIVGVARDLEQDFKQLRDPAGLVQIRPKVERLKDLLPEHG